MNAKRLNELLDNVDDGLSTQTASPQRVLKLLSKAVRELAKEDEKQLAGEGYRLLRGHEIIQDGDECYGDTANHDGAKEWHSMSKSCIGDTASMYLYVRRCIAPSPLTAAQAEAAFNACAIAPENAPAAEPCYLVREALKALARQLEAGLKATFFPNTPEQSAAFKREYPHVMAIVGDFEIRCRYPEKYGLPMPEPTLGNRIDMMNKA